jgi:hypothetical protein
MARLFRCPRLRKTNKLNLDDLASFPPRFYEEFGMTKTSEVPDSGPHVLPQSAANILLVDDNAGDLQALRSILEPLGHNLVESHSGGKVRTEGHIQVALLLL